MRCAWLSKYSPRNICEMEERRVYPKNKEKQ